MDVLSTRVESQFIGLALDVGVDSGISLISGFVNRCLSDCGKIKSIPILVIKLKVTPTLLL